MKFLVLCSFGDQNTLAHWAKSHTEFDMAFCFYGEREDVLPPQETQYYLKRKGHKFPNFIKLFDRFPALFEYDWFLFLDDDLILKTSDVSSIFELAWKNKLDLCQPSLSHDSAYSWSHLLNNPKIKIEYSNFIEIQAFCVSREFLKRVFPYFYMSECGWGVDVAIHHILSKEKWRAAILHTIQITHPLRPEEQTVRGRIPDFQNYSKQIDRRIDFCFGLPIGMGIQALSIVSYSSISSPITHFLMGLGFLKKKYKTLRWLYKSRLK